MCEEYNEKVLGLRHPHPDSVVEPTVNEVRVILREEFHKYESALRLLKQVEDKKLTMGDVYYGCQAIRDVIDNMHS
ncbi:MAG: hypothetical protein PVG39_07930 [Desulfobacteraceae bacterium]|jgi:hypothetical protein